MAKRGRPKKKKEDAPAPVPVPTQSAGAGVDPRILQAFDMADETDKLFIERVRAVRLKQKNKAVLNQQDANVLAKFNRRMDEWTAKKVYSSLTHGEFLNLVKFNRGVLSDYMNYHGLAGVSRDGAYNLFVYLDWVADHITTRTGAAVSAAELSHQENLTRIKGERAQLELDQMRGDLDAEFDRDFETYCRRVCQIFVQQPKRLALRLANKSAQEVEAELSAYNRLVVAELSEGRSATAGEIGADTPVAPAESEAKDAPEVPPA
jgi:hypothetical protein